MSRRCALLLLVALLVFLPDAVSAVEPTPTPATQVYLPVILRPALTSIPPADVAAVLGAIKTRFDALPDQTNYAARVSLAEYIRTLPHIAAADVAEEDSTVWARFSDGRLLTIPLTLPKTAQSLSTREIASTQTAGLAMTRQEAFSAALSAVEMPDPAVAAPAQELPAGDIAYVHDALGTCFTDSAPQIASWLTAKNYVVPPVPPTVQGLKSVQNASLFYLDSHGGTGRTPITQTYTLWTLTPWSLIGDVAYLDDLLAGRLAYMLANQERDQTGQSCIAEWHYAITADFVSQYMTFAPRSFVFFNGCSGMSSAAGALRNAFAQKGVSRYLGWTRSVLDYDSYLAGILLFDQMLGANTIVTDTLPQRPFDFDSVYGLLLSEHLDDSYPPCGSSPSGYCTSLLREDDFATTLEQTFNLLAPTIERVRTRKGTYGTTQPPMALEMNGEFGSEPGKVTVGGQELALHTWTPDFVRAALPGSGPGSAGDVVVSVRNHASNAVPLSEWRGRLRWREDYTTIVPAPGLYAEVDCQLQLRADYHPYRTIPLGSLRPGDAEVVAGQDLRCTWVMGGDVTWVSLGDLYRGVLTGSGEVTWRDGQGAPGPQVFAGGIISPTGHTMDFGAGTAQVYGELVVYREGVYQHTDQINLLGTGIVTMPLDATGNMMAGSDVFDWILGRSTTTWDNIPVQHAPTDRTPG